MIEKAGTRSTIWLRALIALGNPAAYENEGHTVFWDWSSRRALHKKNFTMTNRTWNESKSKWKSSRMKQIPRASKKDLQGGVLLSTETGLKIKDMGNIELSLRTTTDSDITIPAMLNSFWGRISILSQMRWRYTSGRLRNVKTSQLVVRYQEEKSRRKDRAATLATTLWQSERCHEAQSARRNIHLHAGPLPKLFKIQRKPVSSRMEWDLGQVSWLRQNHWQFPQYVTCTPWTLRKDVAI